MNIYHFVSIAPLALGVISVALVVVTRALKSNSKGEHARNVIKNFQNSHGHQH